MCIRDSLHPAAQSRLGDFFAFIANAGIQLIKMCIRDSYIIIGGTGFIGTHLTILIKQQYPDAQVYKMCIRDRYYLS